MKYTLGAEPYDSRRTNLFRGGTHDAIERQ